MAVLPSVVEVPKLEDLETRFIKFWTGMRRNIHGSSSKAKLEYSMERKAKSLASDAHRKFDRRQLDDRRAKFLMLRSEENKRAGVDLFRDFKEAIELTDKILRQDDPQRYPFETLAEIVRIYVVVGHRLDDGHKELINKWLDQLAIYARKRIGMIPSGYQSDKAQIAIGNIDSRSS